MLLSCLLYHNSYTSTCNSVRILQFTPGALGGTKRCLSRPAVRPGRQLLTTPPEPLPFRAAIMESERTSLRINASANGSLAYKNVSDHFNCRYIDRLRNLPIRDLKEYLTTASLTFLPTEDSKMFVANLTTSVEKGRFVKVPFIIGTSKDESSHAFSKSCKHICTIGEVIVVVIRVEFRIPTKESIQNADQIMKYMEASLGHRPDWPLLSMIRTFQSVQGCVMLIPHQDLHWPGLHLHIRCHCKLYRTTRMESVVIPVFG
jgi:hypothetical protein